MDKATTKKSNCPLDCPDSCGLLVHTEDGRVISLQGDPDHPYTNGFICKKMRSYPKRLYSDKRILWPMVRTGKKGAGEFRRVCWDEAFNIAAERLLQIRSDYGGEAILPYSYAGNMGAVSRSAGYPLFHKLGTSQLEQTICSATARAGWKMGCGGLAGCPPENAADSDLILAWGINVKISNMHFWQYISKARKNGGQLLVIDPYRNQTAQAADHFIQIRPGGDAALALGALKVLLEEDKLDDAFINQHTLGFAELSSYLQGISFNALIDASGVSGEQIRWFANQLAINPAVFFRIGVGLSRNSRGGMGVRAITSLAAALGLFGGGRGRGVLLTSSAFSGDEAVLRHPQLLETKTPVINMIQLGHALTSHRPKIRGLVVYNSNPLSVAPDSSMVEKGLAREDLFTMVHEQVLTPTARFADLLLPATTFLENHDVYTGYGQFYCQVVRPVIEPIGEAKSNFDLFQELAQRMGFSDQPFKESCEERIQNYLQSMAEIPEDLDLEEIMAGKLVHSTRSRADGRMMGEGERYCFAVAGGPDDHHIPCLFPADESADMDLLSRYPLHLLTPPHPDLLNSTFGDGHSGELGPLLIHPEDAKRYQIAEGDLVEIYNHRGRSLRNARISLKTAAGVVVAEGLYWPADSWEVGKNHLGINALTSQNLADLGGGALFHESLVAIRRAAASQQ